MLMAPAAVQAQFDKGLNYKIETSATVSGGHNTPFWLVANKHGLSSCLLYTSHGKDGHQCPGDHRDVFLFQFQGYLVHDVGHQDTDCLLYTSRCV